MSTAVDLSYLPEQSPLESLPTVQAAVTRFGEAYLRRYSVTPEQEKALTSILCCRTIALGGANYICPSCGHREKVLRSCGNRNCPTCQGASRDAWVENRMLRMVPVGAYHGVLTVPEQLRVVAAYFGRTMYGLMFEATTEALKHLATKYHGTMFGFTVVLHTWSREMTLHPHLHIILTSGGFDLKTGQWIPCPEFFAPIEELSDLFRDKLLKKLRRAYRLGFLVRSDIDELSSQEAFDTHCEPLSRIQWVAYLKEPFGGAKTLVRYLGSYTHRIAISNHRILDIGEDTVTIATRDGNTLILSGVEFVRRLMLHVVPKGFTRIRHYGLYAASGVKRLLPLAFDALGVTQLPPPHDDSWVDRALRLYGKDPLLCPSCRAARMELEEEFGPFGEPRRRAWPRRRRLRLVA